MKLKHKFVDALLVLYLWMAVATRIEGNCTEKGWFGPNCTFMCHCMDGSNCDQVSGECGPNVQCSTGWFGRGCQYVDAWYNNWASGSPSWLTDGNTSTCNPDSKAMALNLTRVWWLTITWIRIHTDIDMSSYDLEFELTFGNCTDKKLFKFSETILDINCDSDEANENFFFRGPIVGHICDIKFSFGRNLAIRQKASQSSDFKGSDLSKVQASNAVDGSRKDTYSQIDQTGGMPWWKLEFSFLCIIYMIDIYSNEDYLYHFNRITVILYNSNSNIYGYFHHDQTGHAIRWLRVKPPKGKNQGNRIEISIKERSTIRDNFFSLREVEVYGEIVRQTGKWGFYGQESCKCGPHESCNQVTGLCASPCFNPGHVFNATILKCSYPCRPNCVGAVCQGTGDCPSCVAEQCRVCRTGFSGVFCKQDCPKGMFGENCSSQCSSNCSDSLCNSVSGDCLACPENRVMPRCILKDKPKRDKEKEKEFHYSYLFSLVALLPVLCCLFCCLCGKKRAKAEDAKKPEDEGAEDNLSAAHLSQTGSSVDS